eukprot:TRINITY_DN1986_c0_g2_i2.p1 TRINITY_DN1986_c0_g2~~TRINITY_DN1986_c0_g2_i2.p1  ORF type:complete len:266 (+),score=69.69 TRINITY_DN1986_c0_g2_i2:48-845(+)
MYRSRGFSTPFFAPTPFWSFTPPPLFSFFSGPTVTVSPSSGGVNIIGILMAAMMLWMIISTIRELISEYDNSNIFTSSPKISILQLQVGLLGSARDLQRDLDRLALNSDVSSVEGLHQLLSETVLALMRNPEYCVSARSTSQTCRTVAEGEKAFGLASMEERSKFKEETLVNVGKFRRELKRATRREGGMTQSEYIVVTLLVAVEGKLDLGNVRSSADLRAALLRLGQISSSQFQALEILWTPQNENDTLSEQEVLMDYPELCPI